MTESRTDQFMRRVKNHLSELDGCAARRFFLETQIELWEERYREFQIRVVAGNPPKGYSAFDYAETLAALGAELAKHKQPEAA